MKIIKTLPIMVIGLAAAVVVGAGCKKSSTTSGAAPAASGVTQAQAVGHVMSTMASAFAQVRAQGSARPATVSSVACPTSGTISLNTSGMTSSVVGSTDTFGGNVVATFTNCVADGHTINSGNWTEGFSFRMVFTPAPPATTTSVGMNGTLSVPATTLMVDGASCAVNMTDTLTNVNVNFSPVSVTGTVGYNGSVCGTAGSGTITF